MEGTGECLSLLDDPLVHPGCSQQQHPHWLVRSAVGRLDTLSRSEQRTFIDTLHLGRSRPHVTRRPPALITFVFGTASSSDPRGFDPALPDLLQAWIKFPAHRCTDAHNVERH
jgi:hypothetical protein